ncbi:MAG: flagellar basal-body rod protein FlgG [Phycisphaerales bacterium]|nr:flagellar basal-body rod protein FlgG [Phycisphaerales bacterium]
MSVIALHSAATGLTALNTELDVIANNLANLNTTGFKASRANFQDLLYIEKKQAGVENLNGDQRPIGLYVGLGTQVSGTQKNFELGPAEQTGRELDLLIEGAGFFQVKIEDDRGRDGIGYTRAGNLTLNSRGELVLATDQGRVLYPAITIPEDAVSISIGSNGIVTVGEPGGTQTQVGQIETATFVNPAGLEEIGENLFVATDASGDPITGAPTEENRGGIRQGFLEGSNVEPVRELVHLIKSQRAFELNGQVIRAADDALQQVNQLHRR